MRRVRKRFRNNLFAELLSAQRPRSDRGDSSRSAHFVGLAAAWIAGITLSLTIVSITLYAAGKTYRASYLHELGAMASMIPWPSQDVIYLGAITQLQTLTMVYPALAVALTALIAINWLMDQSARVVAENLLRAPFFRKKLWKLIAFFKRNSGPGNALTAFHSLFTSVGFILFSLFAATIFYIANAEDLGRKNAIEDRKAVLEQNDSRIKERGLIFTTVQRYLEGKPTTEAGYAFSCSDKACFLLQRSAYIDKTSGVTMASTTTKFVPLDNLANFSIKTN